MNNSKRKIIIPGGTGFLGQSLIASSLSEKYEFVVLSRNGTVPQQHARLVPWDACTLGEWAREIDGAYAVINMTGKNIKCIHTDKNLKVIRDSRVNSAKVIGQAIKQAQNPPSIWIQMSSATIYKHRFDTPNSEKEGLIGEDPQIPTTWKKIVSLIQDWEDALYESQTNNTRKIAARCGVVMGLNPGGAFDIFIKLCRWGLGGSVAGGKQMVSWLHTSDFIKSIDFLLNNNHIQGPVNLCAPKAIPQSEIMKVLRQVVGAKFGLPAPKWAIKLSSYIIGIDSELILKSHYVKPQVLIDNQFPFEYSDWLTAAKNLYSQWKKTGKGS